jgi:hypothetical protein
MYESEAQDHNNVVSKENDEQQKGILTLRQEILNLETKIVEVTHLIHRQPLSSSVRSQLRDDLEYYKQAIEKKRNQLQQVSGGTH